MPRARPVLTVLLTAAQAWAADAGAFPADAGGAVYEAERARLAGGAFPFHDFPEFTGDGYAGGFWIDGASTTFDVPVVAAGHHRVSLRYRTEPTPRGLAITLDGKLVLRTVLPASGAAGQVWAEQAEV